MNGPVDTEAAPALHWDALVVGESPSLHAAFEARPVEGGDAVDTGWICRGRSLRLTRVPGELAAVTVDIDPGSGHATAIERIEIPEGRDGAAR